MNVESVYNLPYEAVLSSPRKHEEFNLSTSCTPILAYINLNYNYLHAHFLNKTLNILWEEPFWYSFSSVQLLSHIWFFATPWIAARQASLSITNSWNPPKPCPFSQWYHPTISSSVIPFSFCPQSFPASGSFQMSQLFTSGGQSIGVSASASVLPMNVQDQSPLGWTGWISLQFKGLSRVFSNTTVQKHQFFSVQLSL